MGSFGREAELEVQLMEAGNSLLDPPSSVDGLLTLLDEVENLLSNVEQAPSKSMQDALLPSMKALISRDLLKHPSVDVRVSLASCLTEITRITAPDAPYNDEEMKEIFQLTVAAFENLADVSGRCYRKAESIVDTVAKVRSCLVMLDLECDELIMEIFQLFLKIIRPNHSRTIFFAMETIMTMVIEETEDISSGLLNIVLASVRKENENISPMSWKLGKKVLTSCARRLKPYINEALKSTDNGLDMYSPVVASICHNEALTDEDHKVVYSEEHEEDEKKSLKDIVIREPLKGTAELSPDTICPENVCQALDDDSSKPLTSDATENENVRKQNSSNILKQCSISGLLRRSDASGKKGPGSLVLTKVDESEMINSESISKKRGRKPNSLMNPDEGYNHSWISAEKKASKTPARKKPYKKGDDSSSSENPVSKEAPATEEEIPEAGHTIVISLPSLSSGLAGPRKRGRAKRTDQDSDSLPLSALKREASGVDIEKKTHLGVTVKTEPEEEYEMSSKQRRFEKLGRATKTKKKDSDGATPKVIKEASESKKIPLSATKPPGNRNMETPKSNSNGKGGAGKEVGSEMPGIGEELVGQRIRVWWPLDKTFYEGVVDMYDHVRKRHRVIYSDGDTEVLNLRKQRWEFIKEDSLAKEEQEADPLISGTLSDMLQKQKENRNKESAKKANVSSSKRNQRSVNSSKRKDEAKAEMFTGVLSDSGTQGNETKERDAELPEEKSNTGDKRPKVDSNPKQNENEDRPGGENRK